MWFFRKKGFLRFCGGFRKSRKWLGIVTCVGKNRIGDWILFMWFFGFGNFEILKKIKKKSLSKTLLF